MISHNQIQYILSVIREQNFQKAADKCFVSQPTLSMQIKKAEEILGGIIINRNRNPLELTDYGKTILPHLISIEDAFLTLKNEVKKNEGEFKEEVIIGIIPTVSIYLTGEIYNFWHKKFNNIHLKIVEYTSEQLLIALKNKKVDLAIMAGPLTDYSYPTTLLYLEKIKVYAPQLVSGKVNTHILSELQPWLLSKDNCLRTQMVSFCDISPEESKWDYDGGSMQILIEMTKKLGGYTLVPEYYTKIQPQISTELKETVGNQPARSIIGFHLPRNTKKDILNQIMKQIKLAFPQENNEGLEILPWK